MSNYQNEFESEKGGLRLVILPDLRQKHIEAIEAEINKLPHLIGTGASSKRGAMIRAAIAAEWISEPQAEVLKDKKGHPRYMLGGEAVADMLPAQVYWYGVQIDKVYSELTDITPFF